VMTMAVALILRRSSISLSTFSVAWLRDSDDPQASFRPLAFATASNWPFETRYLALC
jgi:hypothetical protein